MVFTYHISERMPIKLDPWTRASAASEWVLRPVPRIGERVMLDGGYFDVTDVVHSVQREEVHIHLQAV